MVTIKGICPEHGSVELPVSAVAVIGMASYALHCPDCPEPILKPADLRTVELLLSSGCRQYGSLAEVRFLDRSAVTEAEVREFVRLLRHRKLLARYVDDGGA